MGQGFIFSSKRLWFLFLKNKGWGFLLLGSMEGKSESDNDSR